MVAHEDGKWHLEPGGHLRSPESTRNAEIHKSRKPALRAILRDNCLDICYNPHMLLWEWLL